MHININNQQKIKSRNVSITHTHTHIACLLKHLLRVDENATQPLNISRPEASNHIGLYRVIKIPDLVETVMSDQILHVIFP